MFEEQQEINSETISRYVNSLHKLSICTGKCDLLLSYIEQNYDDKFLVNSLLSILNDITNVNQDNKYERMQISSDSFNFHIEDNKPITNISKSSIKQDILYNKGVLNTKEVQTPHEDIKVANINNDGSQNEHLNKPLDDKYLYAQTYILKNSTNLNRIWWNYLNEYREVFGITLNKNNILVRFENERYYIYKNVNYLYIRNLIELDIEKMSPGKYFNSEIKNVYEYEEVTDKIKKEEIVG